MPTTGTSSSSHSRRMERLPEYNTPELQTHTTLHLKWPFFARTWEGTEGATIEPSKLQKLKRRHLHSRYTSWALHSLKLASQALVSTAEEGAQGRYKPQLTRAST